MMSSQQARRFSVTSTKLLITLGCKFADEHIEKFFPMGLDKLCIVVRAKGSVQAGGRRGKARNDDMACMCHGPQKIV